MKPARSSARLTACAVVLFAACLPCDAATRLAVIASQAAGVEKLAPLVELRLGKNEELTLLDREHLKEILREQELSALTTAEGMAKRVSLGKLLKADLLAILQGEENPKPHARLVVCETRYGLRLCADYVEISDSPEADAAKVGSLIDEAVKKHLEKINEIVAVPPFVSNDLGFESQILQRPLASAIEQSLLHRPGVLVVELAEARAVAGEVAVGGEKNFERRLPLYLLGDFRQQEPADGGKFSVRLRLLRGQKPLGECELNGIARDDLAATLRREAAGLIDKAVGGATALPDPAVEALLVPTFI